MANRNKIKFTILYNNPIKFIPLMYPIFFNELFKGYIHIHIHIRNASTIHLFLNLMPINNSKQIPLWNMALYTQKKSKVIDL